jgi:hypothetical protein
MSKKSLFLLIIPLFILLFVASVYLFIQVRQRSPDYYDESLENVGKTFINQLPGDPIVKRIVADNEGIIYNIEGKFSKKLEKQGVLLSGKFIIKDDPLEREINVLIGAADGNVSYGIYDGSFNDSSTWKVASNDVVAELISPGTQVLIRVELQLAEERQVRKYIKEQEEIMDAIIRDFQIGEFTYKIPADFTLVAMGIAVVK